MVSSTALLAEKQRRVRRLELVLARYGLDGAPFAAVSALERLRAEIAFLEHITPIAPVLDAAVPMPTAALAPLPRQIQTRQLTSHLLQIEQTLSEARADLAAMSPHCREAVERLLEQAYRDLTRLRVAWEQTQLRAVLGRSIVEHFRRQLNQVESQLHLLALRHIHSTRLQFMELQQVKQEEMLSFDQRRNIVEQSLADALREITRREELAVRNEHERKLLRQYRKNASFFQEVLAGRRPYIALGLWNNLEQERASIAAIDAQLRVTQYHTVADVETTA